MACFKWHLAVNETRFAFISARNLCINLRGCCQIMSWETEWWGMESSTWKSITAWNGREKPTSGWWTLCSECKVTAFNPTLHTFSGTATTESRPLHQLIYRLDYHRCLYSRSFNKSSCKDAVQNESYFICSARLKLCCRALWTKDPE